MGDDPRDAGPGESADDIGARNANLPGAPDGALTGVLAHPMVEQLARRLAERRPVVAVAPGAPGARRAAVALVLRVDGAGALELLMIQRATYEGDPWSGHIALPGGREEPGDGSLERTAIRETREETAIDLERQARVLGRLDDVEPLTVRLPRIVIAPFVAVVGGAVSPVLSDEVARAFWVPVSVLRAPGAVREVVLDLTGGQRSVRSFQYGEYVIWGLTERILEGFLALLD